MRPLIVLVVISAVGFPLDAQVTFSEIMFDPATNENHDEFVELFNLSATDSADLNGYFFSDGEGIDKLLPLSGSSRIPPNSFALILDGSYPGNSSTYDSVLTQGVTT